MVATRFSDEELAELDAKRGDMTRSAFLRHRSHTARPRKDTPNAEHRPDDDRDA